MKIQTKELVSVWAMTESSQDRKQLTLRLDTDSYLKLHALKDLFNRPVNEMINDLIKLGLEEVISNLPVYTATESEAEPEIGFFPGDQWGPAFQFRAILSKLNSDMKSNEEIKQDEAA